MDAVIAVNEVALGMPLGLAPSAPDPNAGTDAVVLPAPVAANTGIPLNLLPPAPTPKPIVPVPRYLLFNIEILPPAPTPANIKFFSW